MSEVKVYPIPPHRHNISSQKYQEWYQESITQPEFFWALRAKECIDWYQPWEQVCQYSPTEGRVSWFKNGKLNVSYNCIDRHLSKRAHQTAILWEGDDPTQSQQITYQSLYLSVCKLANVLKSQGVQKGDRVCIYMPMIPEAVYAMLACTRIGAVHSVVFGGFSPDSLKDRILDSDCRVVITANVGLRGGKKIPLKNNVDKALLSCPNVHSVIVVKNTEDAIDWVDKRDIWYHEATETAAHDYEPEVMDAEDPLFILYTSGSTGKPKGVLHTQAGYLLQAMMTHKYVLDYQEGDVYWCTADVGWVTGHSYIVYGPLANGAISLVFEGIPTYPDAGRFWQVIEKHQVTIFYTAPTAIRALMAAGDAHVLKHNRDSLRLLGSVGEPINPEAWEWYYHVVGNSKCPIVDTWWQTETGAIMIAPMPGAMKLKPGSATKPFFGVKPVLLNEKGGILEGEAKGSLVIEGSWPSQIRSIFGNHERCIDTYYKTFPGYYVTGDGAYRDADGDYWITGRIDDVLNVSGHRLGTAEIESALVLHPTIAEAAVVGVSHAIKGQAVYAFVTPMEGIKVDENLPNILIQHVGKEIGAIAKPDFIQITRFLPKTRSGKIMRRILRKIANNDLHELGDTSTLADPTVVEALIQGRVNLNNCTP